MVARKQNPAHDQSQYAGNVPLACALVAVPLDRLDALSVERTA
jgi:hypothetical protein